MDMRVKCLKLDIEGRKMELANLQNDLAQYRKTENCSQLNILKKNENVVIALNRLKEAKEALDIELNKGEQR